MMKKRKSTWDKQVVIAETSAAIKAQHTNKIDQEYVDYLNDIDPDLANKYRSLSTRLANLTMVGD